VGFPKNWLGIYFTHILEGVKPSIFLRMLGRSTTVDGRNPAPVDR